jgi:hypothetical protein
VVSHLQDLAGVQRALADACEQLARHIDTVHSDIENELGSLTLQSGIVEGIGFLLSFPTAGAAELPTQGVEASRIAAVARRVADLIRMFIEAARALAATISGLADRAVQVTSKVKAILDLNVAAAAVVMSRRYPLVGHVAERFAAARLALGFKGGVLVHLEDGKYFDPQVLEGMTVARVRASIPKTWERRPSTRGEGTVFVDPRSPKRQIRIMTGYAKGSRPDEITTGPYAVVSGGRGGKTKIPLAGNPVLK